MKKLTIIASALLAISVMWALPGYAAVLYEDQATGQLFTKPAEGRVAVDPEKSLGIPKSALSNLYTDESGLIYTKPGEGRTPLAEPEPAAAEAERPAPEPLKAEEVREVLPDWMKKIKLYGDFRLRYQYEDQETEENVARHRARYRLRVGMEAALLKTLKLDVGLASGNNPDSRSTNQTFEDAFSKKSLWIDYAYVKFTPADWLSVSGGRMKIPFWKPKDLVFDEDLNYEGGAVNLSYQTPYPASLFLNGALFILDEDSGSDKDPFMYLVQPGINFQPAGKINAKLAAAYYGFLDVEDGLQLANSKSTNSFVTVGGKKFYKYNYNSYGVNGEVAVKDPVPGWLKYAAVFGDFIYNPDAPVLNTGWQGGIALGHEKVKNAGDWQLAYNYRRLERDAVLDNLPDSDFFGGETDAEGHEVELRYGILKDFNIKFDYYRARKITSNIDENLLQVDLNYAF